MTAEKAHVLTEREKDLRERLSPEDWMVVKAGFLRSYLDGQVDGLSLAGSDIKARIDNFSRLAADSQYMNALHDSWGLVANRRRDAEQRLSSDERQGGER